jgi:hypothetical protein
MFRSALVVAGVCLASLLATFGSAVAAPTEVEGAAGGGLAAWAFTAPNTPQFSFWYVSTQDYLLQVGGISGTAFKRLELSYAQQWINAPMVGNALALNSHLGQSIIGAKYLLVDANPHNAVPSIAVGLQAKNAYGQIVQYLKSEGAISSASGVDFYLAATKTVKLGSVPVVLDSTFRVTKANQFGLLGFGGGSNGHNGYQLEPEFSVGAFVAANVAIGGEYRYSPNNISSAVAGIQEQSKWDIFAALFLNSHFALTAAYLNLGQVGPRLPTMTPNQQGLYLQAQGAF